MSKPTDADKLDDVCRQEWRAMREHANRAAAVSSGSETRKDTIARQKAAHSPPRPRKP